MRCVVCFVLFVVTLLAGPHSAFAASLASQGAQVSGNGFGDNGSPAGPGTRRAADGFTGSFSILSAEAIGRSFPGRFAGYVRASVAPNGGPTVGTARANASAFFQLDGIVVTRLPGYESLPSAVETTARLAFTPDSSFEDFTNFSGGFSGGTDFSFDGLSSATPTATSTATLMVGESRSLNAAAQIAVQVESEFTTRVAGFTASLAEFIVPEGYVVNAPDGHIVDNVYVGPSGPVVGGVEGDYNFDGLVDAADYPVWRDAFDNGTDLPNDTTPDDVTAADYDLWAANYGGPAAPASSVPEPIGTALLAMAGLAAVMKRR